MSVQEIIVPCVSPHNSPLWVVPKKAERYGKPQWRIVIDYCKLDEQNLMSKLDEQTIDDKFPFPNI